MPARNQASRKRVWEYGSESDQENKRASVAPAAEGRVSVIKFSFCGYSERMITGHPYF